MVVCGVCDVCALDEFPNDTWVPKVNPVNGCAVVVARAVWENWFGAVEPTVKPDVAVNDNTVPLDINDDAGFGNTWNCDIGVWKLDGLVETDEDAPDDISPDARFQGDGGR